MITAAGMKSLRGGIVALLMREEPMTMTEIVAAMTPTDVDVKRALIGLKNEGRVVVDTDWKWSAVSHAEEGRVG